MTEFENNENKRPSFNGDFIRNLSTSAYNVLHYSVTKRFWKTVLTYFMIFLLIITSVAIGLGCLAIRTRFDSKNNSGIVVYFVPAFINFICIKILDHFFHKIAMFF